MTRASAATRSASRMATRASASVVGLAIVARVERALESQSESLAETRPIRWHVYSRARTPSSLAWVPSWACSSWAQAACISASTPRIGPGSSTRSAAGVPGMGSFPRAFHSLSSRVASSRSRCKRASSPLALPISSVISARLRSLVGPKSLRSRSSSDKASVVEEILLALSMVAAPLVHSSMPSSCALSSLIICFVAFRSLARCSRKACRNFAT
mmetsp:Transcript_37440/g.84844  ORF Transcript_37440/g.84844 Transcript_37440/m.84844 type:complete len:214 (+) Transcript_37440:1540-2181(+)